MREALLARLLRHAFLAALLVGRALAAGCLATLALLLGGGFGSRALLALLVLLRLRGGLAALLDLGGGLRGQASAAARALLRLFPGLHCGLAALAVLGLL